jgi:hypothetical protein
MFRRILILCCVLLLALTQSGCIGFISFETDECENELPSVHIHELTWTKKDFQRNSTKEDFLKEWGKPDEVITKADNVEEWVYNKHLWCGVILFYIVIPAPLILPVCDGFDRILFLGNEAQHIHTKKIVLLEVLFPLGIQQGKPCL